MEVVVNEGEQCLFSVGVGRKAGGVKCGTQCVARLRERFAGSVDLHVGLEVRISTRQSISSMTLKCQDGSGVEKRK